MKLSLLRHQLEIAKTEKQAAAIFIDYLASFGFTCVAFTYYAGHIKTGRKLQYSFVSKALRAWHLHYLEENYADVDRTLEHAYIDTLPVYWEIKSQLAAAKSKREKRIRVESLAYGLDKGLSIPLHGPNQDFASLTLHQRSKETCLKNFETLQFEWLSAAHIFFFYLKKILRLQTQTAVIKNLTRREEQCLSLTAKSWRVEKIAKELKVSPRTVNFHLQNANKKLGTNNKYLAVNVYYSKVGG